MSIQRPLAALLVALLAVELCDVGSATLGANAAATGEKERLLNELDLMEDDGSIETALINYLFAKQVVDRLRKELDVTDLQRKRTYWKQCAFNAVSCFGK